MNNILKQRNIQTIFYIFMDIVGILIAWYGALWVRFDFNAKLIPLRFFSHLNTLIVPIILVTIFTLSIFKLYKGIWSFFSIEELLSLLKAYLVLIPVYFLLYLIAPGLLLPRSVYFLAYTFSFSFMCVIRMTARFMRRARGDLHWNKNKNAKVNRVMIVGAGQAGQMVAKDLKDSILANNDIVCFIDDDLNKLGQYLNGVEVRGTRNDIKKLSNDLEIDQIVFAIPTASGKDKKEILSICRDKTDCDLQVVPSIRELVNGTVRMETMRPVELEDLLGRDRIIVNNQEIFESIAGKTIMVTGGGGSIGSELCRQIVENNPKLLIVFDIYENSIYSLQQELKMNGYNENILFLIGSVRNKDRIDDILKTYHPDVIFHAAAHKHVPLMEESPHEAIKNNVFGTYNVAQSAGENGVEKFVLISTDKAVNPTNIMGASKRLCEEIIQSMDHKYPKTDFVAVRFGNVLGSNGSVIPLFKKQIAAGGPVTVTHPDIIRYFMTIPEAVSLVLQASYYAQGGQIYVLNMGEPMKIDDMARNLIRLSGFEPDVDIPIVYTGLRPGEKLYEELLMGEEGLIETQNNLIFVGSPIPMDLEQFRKQLEELEKQAYQENTDIRKIVSQMVDTYHPSKH